MSWHVNKDGVSIINKMIKEFGKKKNAYIQIFTENDDFYIFDDDDCIVGRGFIYIQSVRDNGATINIINVDKIESIYIKTSDENDANSE